MLISISTGKTAVSVALAHIFGFGHTQSDDVKAKRPAPIFIQNVVKLLEKHDVVIADKYDLYLLPGLCTKYRILETTT